MSNQNGYIGRSPGDSAVVIASQTFEPTGIQTDFTFAAGYDPGYIDVYFNGARLVYANDYTATNGSTVGLTTYANNGDVLELVAYKAFNVGNVQESAGNFSVGNQLTVVGHTTATSAYYTGVVTATSFSGDGSNLTGIANTAYVDAINITASGIVTAASFSGDGSSLTGVAATDYVVSNTLKVLGISTFSGEVQVATAVTIGAAGITTFSKGVHLDGTTTFGKGNAVLLENGFENENAQIVNDGATEKATIVFKTSSGGTVSERLRIKDTGDVDLSGSAAGVSSVTWDASADSLIFKDGSYAKFGDSSDLSIYHDGTTNIIDSASANLEIRHGAEKLAAFAQDGQAELWFDSSKKFETTNTGAIITGICTATSFSGDGSSLTGIAATSNINTNNIQVSGITTFQSLQEPFDFWLFAG